MIKATDLLQKMLTLGNTITEAEIALNAARDKWRKLTLDLKMLEMQQEATVFITSGASPKVAIDPIKVHAMTPMTKEEMAREGVLVSPEKPDAD